MRIKELSKVLKVSELCSLYSDRGARSLLKRLEADSELTAGLSVRITDRNPLAVSEGSWMKRASVARWIFESSPLEGRTDLNVVGIGIGGASLRQTVGRYYYFCDLFEFLPLGIVTYFDLNPHTVGYVSNMLVSGRMNVPYMEAIDHTVAGSLRAVIAEHDPPVPASFQQKWLQDSQWVMGRLNDEGVETLHYASASGVFRTARSQIIVPETVQSRARAFSADLLDHQPTGDVDLFNLFSVFTPQSSKAAQVSGALLAAASLKPGGLICVEEITDKGVRVLRHGGKPAIQAISPLLKRIGFKKIAALPGVSPFIRNNIWQRPQTVKDSFKAMIVELEAVRSDPEGIRERNPENHSCTDDKSNGDRKRGTKRKELAKKKAAQRARQRNRRRR